MSFHVVMLAARSCIPASCGCHGGALAFLQRHREGSVIAGPCPAPHTVISSPVSAGKPGCRCGPGCCPPHRGEGCLMGARAWLTTVTRAGGQWLWLVPVLPAAAELSILQRFWGDRLQMLLSSSSTSSSLCAGKPSKIFEPSSAGCELQEDLNAAAVVKAEALRPQRAGGRVLLPPQLPALALRAAGEVSGLEKPTSGHVFPGE